MQPHAVLEIVKRAKPEPLKLPVSAVDHADHMLKTALAGHPQLAADHVLHPDASEILDATISALVRRIDLMVRSEPLEGACSSEVERRIVRRARAYELLLNMAANLIGVERRWARISESAAERALSAIASALESWERCEAGELGGPAVLEAVIEKELRRAERVNRGRSMVAWMAGRIRSSLARQRLASSYLAALREVLTRNFYRVAYEKGLCKFGNDYALGLRWLRHLGFVQVSTNPVLAARAYDDDPELWESFEEHARRTIAVEHPEWFKDPEAHADDLTMEATRFALLENFQVFRVPFILSGYHDGLVSYQLNPLIAHDVEKSVKAVQLFVERLERDLAVYDEYLWWGYRVPEKGRPNVVIKVAAAFPASLEIVERINEMGVGQNITLSYTVSQEVLLGVAAMRGMARALKKGIIPTQTYDTNMGGRLEDHLREVAASSLLLRFAEGREDAWEHLDRLAAELGVSWDEWRKARSGGLRSAVEFLCSVRVLGRDMRRKPFIDALAAMGAIPWDEAERAVSELEEAIRMAGTFVARRVYEILFSPVNRERWIEYLVRRVGVTREQAELVLDRIDLLPASKRKPLDTLLTLSSRNVTNTEFPDQQLSVIQQCSLEGVESLRDTIERPNDGSLLSKLMAIEDFVKAYEASPEVNDLLKEAGIDGHYGSRGVRPHEWPSYGPCAKTLNEFTEAYLAFRRRVVELARRLSGGREA
ncbi:MAG: transaldolase family protein [Thermofilaceae archaeon]